jgi:hypothetical protein
MNLNNNISNQESTKSTLTRGEIDAFRINSSEAESNQLDEFEKDALEGWSKASEGTEKMSRLDQQYKSKTYRLIWFSGITLFVLLAIAFFNLNQDQNQDKKIAKKEIILDKQDVVFSKEIQKLKELPEHLLIKPEMVVSNFKIKIQRSNNQKNQNQNNQNQIENEQEYFTLPIRGIQPYSIKPNLKLEKKRAKEIYLNDFKLVDYRSYRSKPEIQSKQITLSGTPADEGILASEKENTNWKAIDVPYHDYINQTVEQFKTANFKQTLNRTQYILTFYPEDINALFYGGLCFYNLNEIDQAIESFQKVIANPFNNFDEEALWYLANAYDLKNDKIKAKELFQMIANQKGYYAKQADKMLKK